MAANGFIQVVLNSIGFDGQIADFSRTGSNLESSTSMVSNPSECKGLVLSDWVDRVRDVGDLISLYKQLIEKDVSSLKDTKKAIEDADRERARDILDKVSGVMDSVNDVIRGTPSHTGRHGPENIKISDVVRQVTSSVPRNQWTTVIPPATGTTTVGSAVTGVIRAAEIGSVVNSAGTITGAPATIGAATGFVSGSVAGYAVNANIGAAHGFVGNHFINTAFGSGKGGGGIR